MHLLSKPAGAAVRALASGELAAELDHRGARVDEALCSGPGMYADRAIYHEAARRLLVMDRATELLMRLDRSTCPDCGGKVGSVKAERGPDAHHAESCELIELRRALRAPAGRS